MAIDVVGIIFAWLVVCSGIFKPWKNSPTSEREGFILAFLIWTVLFGSCLVAEIVR